MSNERTYGNDANQINRMHRIGNVVQPLSGTYIHRSAPDCITCSVENRQSFKSLPLQCKSCKLTNNRKK